MSPVRHEVCENVSVTTTGGKLGDRPNCRRCAKNPGHPRFIPAEQFSLHHCIDQWKGKQLVPWLSMEDCYKLIQSLIPLTVRLQSRYVSLDRPGENYPFCDSRGATVRGFVNVGSGSLSYISDRSRFKCDTCDVKWAVRGLWGMYVCPDNKNCERKDWRIRSEDNGKCWMCGGESEEFETGMFHCRSGDCFNREDGYVWKVVEDEDAGKCPWCDTLWWVRGEGRCKCPLCGEVVKGGCTCPKCLQSGESGERKAEGWKIYVSTARHVIFDQSELEKSDVIFCDDGQNKPVKLAVGEYGQVRYDDTKADKFKFKVYTHDSHLVNTLRKSLRAYRGISGDIKKKIDEFDKERREEIFSEGNYFTPGFMIGYPHGRQCYVTLGEMSEWAWPARYSIDSCTGNSGCLVSSHGGEGDEFVREFMPHSGVDRASGEGRSCKSVISPR